MLVLLWNLVIPKNDCIKIRFLAFKRHRSAAQDSRGLVQMVFVGAVLALLLHGSLLVGTLILLMMTIVTRRVVALFQDAG
jgi:hypothetical protein